jgi:hypothetical protein
MLGNLRERGDVKSETWKVLMMLSVLAFLWWEATLAHARDNRQA